VHERVELLPIENGLIGAVSLGEVPKIFAASVMILSPDLTFDTGQRVELRRTASMNSLASPDGNPIASSRLCPALVISG